jgi:hypothetical protein
MDFNGILNDDVLSDSTGLEVSRDMYKESFLRWFDKFKEYSIPEFHKTQDYSYHNIDDVKTSPALTCLSNESTILFPITVLHQCPCDIEELCSNKDSADLTLFSPVVIKDKEWAFYVVTADDIKKFKNIKFDKITHVICACIFESDKVALDFITYVINDLKLTLSIHYQSKIIKYVSGLSSKNISDFIEKHLLLDKVNIIFKKYDNIFDYYSIQNKSTILDE